LEIGISYPIKPDFLKEFKYEMLSTIIDQIKGVDQKVQLDIEFAASLKDVISKDESLISQLNSGFKFKLNLDVLSNFRKVIFDILKNPDMVEGLVPIAMGFAPLLMLQLNAKIDLDFDSFDELKELPMLAPLLANFAQLFEGMSGSDVDTILAGKIELVEEGEEKKQDLRSIIELIHAFYDVFQNMAQEGEVEVNASFPNVASLNLKISSEDLGKAILLGLKSSPLINGLKENYEWNN